jgi:hypothetical protein
VNYGKFSLYSRETEFRWDFQNAVKKVEGETKTSRFPPDKSALFLDESQIDHVAYGVKARNFRLVVLISAYQAITSGQHVILNPDGKTHTVFIHLPHPVEKWN